MCTEITKRHLNNRICQHCGVKTSTVTPFLYYVFNISLSCENSMPSFIRNLWRVPLLRNYLKCWFLRRGENRSTRRRQRKTKVIRIPKRHNQLNENGQPGFSKYQRKIRFFDSNECNVGELSQKYAMKMQINKVKTLKFKVAQSSFQYFPRRRF